MSRDLSRDVTLNVTQSHATELEQRTKNKEKNIDTLTTTTTGDAPSLSEVYLYFKEWLDEGATKEAEKFYAYNANKGWGCLPDWKTTADLWIARIDEYRK